jgi:3-deoxy-D-manno-oct-2-ulosonic acid (Kdo) hydroxylase
VIELTDYSDAGWSSVDTAARARFYCEQLERGEILLIDHQRFPVPQSDRAALTKIAPASLRQKNISYAPSTGSVAGLRGASSDDRFTDAFARYSAAAVRYCAGLLAPYSACWRVELASFRPVEEQDRRLSMTERNDLLHIDAFPGRPTNGARILRFFTNIHPDENRVWLTSDPIPELANHNDFAAMTLKCARIADSPTARALGNLMHAAARGGIALPDRSSYDRAMLRLHDAMKRDSEFQASCPKYRHEFAPGSSWLVFTDTVPHAVLAGQFALEQSFFVAGHSLVAPEASPLAVIEQLVGRAMTKHRASQRLRSALERQ